MQYKLVPTLRLRRRLWLNSATAYLSTTVPHIFTPLPDYLRPEPPPNPPPSTEANGEPPRRDSIPIRAVEPR